MALPVLGKAPYTVEKYFERPEKTQGTVTDGWIHTGDIGKVDDDGYLYLLDRASDVIITGGMNVYSTEVEEAIDHHSDVVEVAVIGVPDDEWGEAVHAVVIPASDGDLTATELKSLCNKRLADYKQDKVALRDRYWDEQEREIA